MWLHYTGRKVMPQPIPIIVPGLTVGNRKLFRVAVTLPLHSLTQIAGVNSSYRNYA
jgi:hypothetical protein